MNKQNNINELIDRGQAMDTVANVITLPEFTHKKKKALDEKALLTRVIEGLKKLPVHYVNPVVEQDLRGEYRARLFQAFGIGMAVGAVLVWIL